MPLAVLDDWFPFLVYGFFALAIPASLIEMGSNTIRISLQSNSGAHSDTIIVTVRQVPSYPVPTPGRSTTVYMTSTSVASLGACGGVVQTKVSNGQLNIGLPPTTIG